MKDELVNKIMDELTKKLGNIETAKPEAAAKAVEDCCCEAGCGLTEFVGTASATPSA